jgi:hypothetical protein
MNIDDWLPQYQVRARSSTHVYASAEETCAALAKVDFAELAIVRRLMRLRGYRLERKKATAHGAPATGRRFGSFVQLAAVPQKEVVLGIAGRFWRLDGGIVRDLSPAQFADFRREGYAKAVWNFSVEAANGGSELHTETRVQTFGRSPRLKFRLYWLLVGPFSGLIRGAMLREIKRMAEKKPGHNVMAR